MKRLLLTSTALLACAPVTAFASDAAPTPATDTSTQPIIVTGTRQTGMRAADSAAPIQVLGAQALQHVAQQDLTQVLAQNLPSLNFQGFGADAANLTLSAALRGINPNDTLVLVNGKRRHFTANLAVDGTSPYQGAATTDFSFIPVGAIDHIEVLQDGAAAQYGSDAIAGVINIITKKADHGGTFTVTGGQYDKGDGKTAAASLNMGFKLGDKGFLNLTGEYRYHDYSTRGTYDRRYFNLDGSLRSTNSAAVNAGIRANGDYPYVNRINGDARYRLFNIFANAGYDLGDGVEAYANGSYGNRVASSYENYRNPAKLSATNSAGTTITPLTTGFSPLEGMREEDFSLTGGVRGAFSQWNWDLSATYGRDAVAISTLNSANTDLFTALQSTQVAAVNPVRNFYDGTFTNSEVSTDLDITRDFDAGLAKPVTLALGGQFRSDTFGIQSGDADSTYGSGAQGYPGFALSDAGAHSRNNAAAYIDVAIDPVKALHLDLAGRYEHYSDFGSVWTGKFNARYDFSPAFAIRGTVSNGFRAPTLAEEYYSATNVSPSSASVQLPPNSAAAALAGFSKLRPEKSTNFSAGFVAHPAQRVQLTVDAYQIKIRDRIVGSGFLLGSNNGTTISQGVLNAITAHGNTLESGISYAGITIFTNGADTRTRGVEATASYASDFGPSDHVDWSLGANYNQTDITRLTALPAAVTNASVGQTYLLSPTQQSALTTATPRVKVIANALWTHGRFSINLRETIYGKTSEVFSLDGTGVNGTTVAIGTTGITDLDIGYKITERVRFNVGSNNLFNKAAPTIPNVSDGSGGVRPANGDSVYNEPAAFTPWGINGGYYYARLNVTF